MMLILSFLMITCVYDELKGFAALFDTTGFPVTATSISAGKIRENVELIHTKVEDHYYSFRRGRI
jgi:hypothetical protein